MNKIATIFTSAADTEPVNSEFSYALFLIIGILFWLIGIAVYLLPTIIAIKKNHHKKTKIIIVNIFFGWLLLGWALSLYWVTKK
jgi:hypothetical protein